MNRYIIKTPPLFILLLTLFSMSMSACHYRADDLTLPPEPYLCDSATSVQGCIDAFSQGCKDGGGTPECSELGESMVINCECNQSSSAEGQQDNTATDLDSGIDPQPSHHCPNSNHTDTLSCIIDYCAGCGAAGGTTCKKTNTDDGVDLDCE